jgi:nitric-oxide synthase
MQLVDDDVSSDPLRRRLRRLTRQEVVEEARAFLSAYYAEVKPTESARLRIADATNSIRRTGHYSHTADELAYGARVAWRNHARCIGRLHWKSLEVLDCRSITDPDEIAGQVVNHMKLADSGGRIRSVISIFAPARSTAMPPYIENGQIIQYAGYAQPDGTVVGDPQNIEFTRMAKSLGWTASKETSFDILPLIIRDGRGRRFLYDLPPDIVREIEIRHAKHDRFNALNLRWYAVPCVSDMILTIGGIEYPCTPFNGHYMATEIASRNLIDVFRYNLLEEIGSSFELNKSDPLWKDEALTELNRAVLESFERDNATVVDHHMAGGQFIEFMNNEHAAGRPPSGDWAWIIPPQASAACPAFHRQMGDTRDVPNFYRSRAIDGAELHISRLAELRSRPDQWSETLRRRWRRWRKRRAV